MKKFENSEGSLVDFTNEYDYYSVIRTVLNVHIVITQILMISIRKANYQSNLFKISRTKSFYCMKMLQWLNNWLHLVAVRILSESNS